MRKLLLTLIVLIACALCISSCQFINSIIPCNHKETVTDAAVAATCTEAGLTEGKHCAKCGEVIVAQETVPALGHTEVIDEAVAATCTEDGLTAGVHCSVCNTTVIAQEVVPASHTYGEWEIITEGDCFTPGEQKRVCSVCSEEEAEKTIALGHSFVQNEESKLFSCEKCDAVIYAGHLYAAFDKICNWFDAYTYCEEMGGHLATITSASEQAIITDMMSTAAANIYWLGGLKNTNGWEWITGEDFIYTNWYTKQPDNKANNEWFLHAYGQVYIPGSWNDLNLKFNNHGGDLHTAVGFICEWELDIVEDEHFFTEWEATTEVTCYGDGEQYRVCTHCGVEETEILPQLEHNFIFNEATGVTSCEHCSAALYNGHIYKIFKVGLSWFDAYTYCNELGGHLLTITSQEEQTFIETYMNSESFRSNVWMGAYNDGNEFHWVTGEEFEYTNWKPGEPNCGNGSGTEYFAQINYNNYFGFWNDLPLFDSLIIGLICEWEAE